MVVIGQLVNSEYDSSAAQLKSYELLADDGYSFDKVRTDTTLRFVPDDSLRPARSNNYWMKLVVINPSRYDEAYNLYVQPTLNNTLYYFDANAQRWVTSRGGANVSYPGRLDQSAMAFMLDGKIETILCVKVDLHLLRSINQVVKPQLLLEKQSTTSRREQRLLITWIASLSVLFLFFLNNLFVYFSFRDKVVLYYLIAQLGGMIYITYYTHIFPALFPCPVFTVGLLANGQVGYYNVESLLQHGSILLIFFGLVQSTRTYLRTSTTLPRLDFVLRYGWCAYLLVSIILAVVNTFLAYWESYTLLYHNILAFVLIGGIISTCVVGYLQKMPAAGPFLLANILPLLFMITTTLFHIFISPTDSEEAQLLTYLTLVFYTLSFSIALVARTKSIQKELIARKIEAQRLNFDMREMALKNQMTELENQRISTDIRHEKTRNEWLQERLDVNQRELASTTMYIVQKNELLAGLKTQLSKLNKQYPIVKQQELKSIESILQSNFYLDADWGKFKVHFEQVHPDFFENLSAKYPAPTKNEVRLYAYFHINLSTKEIAALLNIDPASVRRAKTRLYKKMAISESGNSIS